MLHARWTSTIRMHASRLLVDVHGALHMSAGSPPCMANPIQVAAAEHAVTAELHRAARMPRGALSHMTY